MNVSTTSWRYGFFVLTQTCFFILKKEIQNSKFLLRNSCYDFATEIAKSIITCQLQNGDSMNNFLHQSWVYIYPLAAAATTFHKLFDVYFSHFPFPSTLGYSADESSFHIYIISPKNDLLFKYICIVKTTLISRSLIFPAIRLSSSRTTFFTKTTCSISRRYWCPDAEYLRYLTHWELSKTL